MYEEGAKTVEERQVYSTDDYVPHRRKKDLLKKLRELN